MSCITGKLAYATEGMAEQALYFAKAKATKDKKRKEPVRVFFCPDCGRYHLTSHKLIEELNENLQQRTGSTR